MRSDLVVPVETRTKEVIVALRRGRWIYLQLCICLSLHKYLVSRVFTTPGVLVVTDVSYNQLIYSCND